MTDQRRYTCPGQVRQAMDELEAVVAADAGQWRSEAELDRYGDWTPGVPGCEEPPD